MTPAHSAPGHSNAGEVVDERSGHPNEQERQPGEQAGHPVEQPGDPEEQPGAPAVEQAAEELYALAPAEFTPARTASAARAKKAGDATAAKEIAALRRPTVAAWVINQLVRSDADVVDRMRSLGAELRTAQSELDAARLRELTQQRRELLAELGRLSADLADGAGQKLSESGRREIEETFGAALADEQAALAVTSGRLTRALAYSGFGEIDVTAATATPIRPSPLTRLSDRTRPAGSGPQSRPTHTADKIEDGDEARPPGAPARVGRAEAKAGAADASARAAAAQEAAEAKAATALAEARAAAESALVVMNDAETSLDAAGKHRAELEAEGQAQTARLDELQREILTVRHELDVLSRRVAAAERDQKREERRVRDARTAADRAQQALARLSASDPREQVRSSGEHPCPGCASEPGVAPGDHTAPGHRPYSASPR